jgi:hypothetical protein
MDDQSADLTTAIVTEDAPASAADDSAPASSALTDDHHDWVSAFTGIDTRAASSGGSTAASAGSDDESSGGFFSGLANAVSDAASGVVSTAENVASDVSHTVSDAASGVINTVETVAGDVGHTVSDAANGVVDTAGKVASDIGSGNFGDALGDAASGVVSTTGHVVSDVAHTAVDAGSGMLSTAGKIVAGTEQTITDAATGAISTAGKIVSDTAQAVAQAAGPDSMLGQAAGAVGNFSTSAASGLVNTVNTVNDFNKGVVEGAVGGVEGLAKGVVSLGDSVGKEAFALATDQKAREQAGQTVLHGLEAVGNFEETVVTDPSKALGEVEDAAGGAVSTVENMASNVYKDYQAAAAQGHGAEFIGKGVGQAGVLVAGAVLTDGASLAGEGAAVAGEGAALLGEGAALASEGAAVAGEGAAIAGEGAAVVGEGAAVAGEGAGAVGEGVAAGDGADAAGEALSNSSRVTPEGDGALRSASGDPPPPSEPPPPESPGGGGEPPDGPPELTPDQQRQVEILQEFEERQIQHGGQQMEVADEAPTPALEEPGRMPQFTQGPEPDLRLAKMGDINFSQADVSPVMGDGTPIEQVEQDMADHGWDPTRPDADMVANEDGSLTSIDNRRLVAADGAGVDEVPALVHAADEPLPEEMADRFQLKKALNDPATGETIPKGTNAETWGEAAKFRAANQGREFPLEGSPRTPDIRVPNPHAPPPAPTPPTLDERAAEAMREFAAGNPAAAQVGEEFRSAEAAREADLAVENSTPSRR